MNQQGNILSGLQKIIFLAGCIFFTIHVAQSFAGQGVQRMLYSSPNFSFIETPSGEVVTTVNDTSGSIMTVQNSIANIRATNSTIVIVIRLTNATYVVSSVSLTLGSHECLVASGATIQAANTSVSVPLVLVASGATNVSVSGGTFDGSGANIQAVYAPAAARVNIDKITVRNCGQDCILLKGQGNSAYDNEMTVTRCECYGSPAHAGISIQNSTQTAVLDNFCHNDSVGIYLSCAWANVGNNVCNSNSIGINISGGDDDAVVNNTCNDNATGILAAGSGNMVISDAFANNTTAGISSTGSGSTFADNLFTTNLAGPPPGINFSSGGSGNHVIAYKTPLSAAGQDYFYPPLISDQHTNTIINGMGRTDVTIASTTLDNVQSQYNTARTANPANVIVLHLNGTFTVGATPLALQSNTCVLLNGTIQFNSLTGAAQAITNGISPHDISVSGGVIDGTNLTGNDAICFNSSSMVQVDAMTLQNFGPDNPRVGSSDILRITGGATPQIITRCLVTNGAARGIWLENSGVKRVVSDCESTAVNEDGVDCDASTSGSIVKFCYLHDLVRYGVFFEQSASYNVALGNVCNNCGREINIYNNSTTPRGDTAFNSALCNSLMGNNGLRNGSIGTNVVQSSHNFLFNNTVVNADIESQLYGTNNYYSQNFLAGGALSTAGVEQFFNPTDVSSNIFVQDSRSFLPVVAQSAATSNSTPVVIAPASGLGNDLWALVPTDSGYCRITNKKSQSVMAVKSASLTAGALVIQYTFGSAKNDQWLPMSAGNGFYYFVNRLSGLCLDVSSGTNGAQLDQQNYIAAANQRFYLTFVLATNPPPYFNTVNLSGANLVCQGAGGTSGGNYLLLASTNLASSTNGWKITATNVFDVGGNFNFTNAAAANVPQMFYQLRLP